jgi:hypothetical protein
VPLCIPDTDPEDGACAAGPATYHCSGAGHTFRNCSPSQANGACGATCSKTGGACQKVGDCPFGEECDGTCLLAELCEAGVDGILGTSDDIENAGICIADTRDCPIYGIEGGDTLNGAGDPTNVRSVAAFCLSATGSGSVNQTSGIGGPGRLRQSGINITNGFSTLLP